MDKHVDTEKEGDECDEDEQVDDGRMDGWMESRDREDGSQEERAG